MGGMNAPFFKTLRDALTGSPDWAALDRGWRESEGLREALEKQLPPAMIEQVLQIRRSDPAQGIRGSQVTVVTTTASAAAKIRLTLADLKGKKSLRYDYTHCDIHASMILGVCASIIPFPDHN